MSRSLADKSSKLRLISAVDLFCGAGGLTYGLRRAGITVEAGIDIDRAAEHAYGSNNPGAMFLGWDLNETSPNAIGNLFNDSKVRLLAGCAPCQPFSKLTNGTRRHKAWGLLRSFGRIVASLRPELVTMENVPELAARGHAVFSEFVEQLERCGYFVAWKVVNCADYGAPQLRKRLVLLASLAGEIAVPAGRFDADHWRTVRETIGALPPIRAGELHPKDRIHVAAKLSAMNMRRIRATPHDGGSKDDWPRGLALECHKRDSGSRYFSIYGRMWWDRPAPTMTTLCNGIGNGRFGHPTQDRAISLREAALLQTFPRGYDFWPADKAVSVKAVGRLVGNAVPPVLARALGAALVGHVALHSRRFAQLRATRMRVR